MFEEYEWEICSARNYMGAGFPIFLSFSFFHFSVSFGYGQRRRVITLNERNEILLFPLLEADFYTMHQS